MKATFHGVTLNESVVCDRHVDFQAAFLTPGRCCRDGSGSTIGGALSAGAQFGYCRLGTPPNSYKFTSKWLVQPCSVPYNAAAELCAPADKPS
jgi:hypothetical protein